MQSVDPAYNLLYCFAENKMVPTVGDPITQAAVSTLRHITVQGKVQEHFYHMTSLSFSV